MTLTQTKFESLFSDDLVLEFNGNLKQDISISFAAQDRIVRYAENILQLC